MVWHGVKSIQGGWESAEAFCRWNIDPESVSALSVFSDARKAHAKLEEQISQGLTVLALQGDSDPRSLRLKQNIAFLKGQLDIWENPAAVAAHRSFYRESLIQLKERVEAEAHAHQPGARGKGVLYE